MSLTARTAHIQLPEIKRGLPEISLGCVCERPNPKCRHGTGILGLAVNEL